MPLPVHFTRSTKKKAAKKAAKKRGRAEINVAGWDGK